MVTMVTKQRYLINFTFYETFKDEPIPHKNFTLLGQGSYEITGGVDPTPPPPLVSDVVPKRLVSEGLRAPGKPDSLQFDPKICPGGRDLTVFWGMVMFRND